MNYRRLLSDNAAAAVTNLVGGVLGFAFQAAITHRLKPAAFGEVFVVVSLFTLMTPAASLIRMVAWTTSRDLAVRKDGDEPGSAFTTSASKRLPAIGVAVALVTAAAAPALGHFLRVPPLYILIGAASLPFAFATPVVIGELQGQERFRTWGAVTVGMAAAKLVAAVGLGVVWGGAGVVLGVTVATALTYIVAKRLIRDRLTRVTAPADWRGPGRYLMRTLPSGLAIPAVMGIDLLMVKHFFEPRAAGQYAAVAALARSIFWAMSGVGTVLFPKLAAHDRRSEGGLSVVAASLVIAGLGGALGLLVLIVAGRLVLFLFAGPTYMSGVAYLAWYSVGMALWGGAVVMINTNQALARTRLMWVVVPLGVAETILLFWFHQTLTEVVLVVDVSMAALLVGLLLLYLAEEGLLGRLPEAARLRGRAFTDKWGHGLVSIANHGRGDIVTVTVIAAAGLVVRRAWLTTLPLSASDWQWFDRSRVLRGFPWPGVWDPTLSFMGADRFLSAFRFPIQAATGFIAWLGGDWSLAEKIVYFVPFAVLLPVGGWLLSREVIGKSRWTLLTPLMLLGAPAFLLESGHVPLTLAEAILCFALVAFLRAMRRLSAAWALVTGLLLGIAAAFDVRPAYLGVLLLFLYFVIRSIADSSLRRTGIRAFLGLLVGLAFVTSQMYWILPLVTYHGTPGFPTPQTPDFSIITLGHGIAGVSPYWTGGVPAHLVQAPLDPIFMLIPILALLPLVARRIRPEVLWLALAGLLAAFFAKTDTAPLGFLYDWMYLHLPGWHLFREGSKFLFIVYFSYSVLVPLALSAGWEKARAALQTGALRRVAVLAAVTVVVSLSLANIAVLQSGNLGSTTKPTAEPASFAALSTMLARDHRPGPVFWFGSPTLTRDYRNHDFVIASSEHSLVNLTGVLQGPSPEITHLDPLQAFCTNGHLPYCYLEKDLFPYLVSTTGAAYLIAPGGSDVGVLPAGVSRGWLQERVTSIYGPPQVVGRGGEALLVWRMQGPRSTVLAAPAVALVDGGPWSTRSALPALQALKLPAAYRQTLNSVIAPAAPPGVPHSIAVLPRVDSGCLSSAARSVGVMAKSSADSIEVAVAGRSATLPLLVRSGRLAEWGVYGTLATRAGPTRLESQSVTLGPCVEWSPLTARVLEGRQDPALNASVSSTGTRIAAKVQGQRHPAWLELKRVYDLGWRMGGQSPRLVGDGLFNLYYVDGIADWSKREGGNAVFAFSTVPWEQRGQLISGLGVAVALGAAIWAFRRRRSAVTAQDDIWLECRWAHRAAVIGILLLGCTLAASAAAYFGLPSNLPGQAFASDPYALEIGYGGVAIGFICLSVILRLGEQLLFRRRQETAQGSRISLKASLGFTILAMLLASCAGASQLDTRALLAQARASGDVSATVGSSLEDARVQRAAKQSASCVADYTEALRRIPWLVDAYVGRADCYVGGGRNGAAAVHDYSQALIKSQDQPSILLRRALAYRATGDRASAASDYQQAIQDPSSSQSMYVQAIHGLITINLPTEAWGVYQRGLERYPDASQLHLAAADLEISLDRDQAARAEFAKAAALVKTDADRARVFAARCHFEVLRLEYEQAVQDCSAAVALTSEGSGAYDDMSVAHLALGRVTDAITDLDNAIGTFTGSLGPDAQPAGADGFGLAVLYEARGNAKVEARQSAAAVADYGLAADALPGNQPSFRSRLKVDLKSVTP